MHLNTLVCTHVNGHKRNHLYFVAGNKITGLGSAVSRIRTLCCRPLPRTFSTRSTCLSCTIRMQLVEPQKHGSSGVLSGGFLGSRLFVRSMFQLSASLGDPSEHRIPFPLLTCQQRLTRQRHCLTRPQRPSLSPQRPRRGPVAVTLPFRVGAEEAPFRRVART